MTLARWIYGVAGVCGICGSALVWQLVCLLIACDPVRFRILMPITMLEKVAFSCRARRSMWRVDYLSADRSSGR